MTGYHRRNILQMMVGGVVLSLLAPLTKFGHAWANERIEKMTKPDSEWKKELTPEQYNILREEGTERPFTSALLEEKREGTFVCAACELPLFASNTKFDSGTGWPSFYDAIPEHLESKTDYKIIAPRTEYHCAKCGGHHGHVFNDGPQPTGLRYCNNGAALKFVPKEKV